MTRLRPRYWVTALIAIGACILWVTPAAADQVILDDLIVDGSLCVGQDCSNGESFGFDTIRLKENNLRIRFVDTSNSAAFPSRDWQITANESSNGGKNAFMIDDIDGSRTPFTIEASAPSHSLYVEDGGRIGFGTSTPVVELHVKDGNTPTLRLEQDGSSGFTAQTWDVAGNEANFFIRDVTGGSDLVLKIKPGAPTSSIFIASDGDIGLGTESPDAGLDIEDSSLPRMRLTEAGGTTWDLVLDGASDRLNFQVNGNSDGTQGAGTRPFKLDESAVNNLLRVGTENSDEVTINGNLVISGTCTSQAADCAADYVFEPDYDLESIEEHSAYMWEKRHLRAVGAGADDVNVIKLSYGMLEELEKAHIYIDQLNLRLQESEDRNQDLLSRLEAIEQMLAKESSGTK